MHGGFPADAADEIVQAATGDGAAGGPGARHFHGTRRGLCGRFGRGRLAVGDGERGAGHDDAGIGLEKPAAEEVGDVHGRGVQREVPLGFAGAFHPVHVVFGLLAEEFHHFGAEFAEATVALDEFLADVLVVAQFDEFADGFAEALDGEGDVVGHEFGAADAEFLPFALAGGGTFAAAELRLGLGLDILAGGLDVGEKFVGLAEDVGDELHGLALAEGGEEAFFRARIPEAVQRVADLAAGNAQADMARGDALHGVGFVKDDEVVLEEDAAFHLFIHAAEQGEEERVVQDEDIRGQDLVPHALEETGLVVAGEIGLVAAGFGRAQAAFGADLLPDLGVGLDGEIGEAAVLGLLGPFVDALEFLGLGGGEEVAALLHGFLEAAGAEVIRAAFQHGVAEADGFRQGAEHLREHGQVLFGELLLEIDGVGGDDGLFLLRDGEEDGGDEVGEGFAHAGAGLDGEVAAVLQGAGHGHGHLLLLGAELEVLRARQNALGGKDFGDLGDQVGAGGLDVGERNHFRTH